MRLHAMEDLFRRLCLISPLLQTFKDAHQRGRAQRGCGGWGGGEKGGGRTPHRQRTQSEAFGPLCGTGLKLS